jgi:hypothetical protein
MLLFLTLACAPDLTPTNAADDEDVTVPLDRRDVDADGWPDVDDCAPRDRDVHPNAREVCDGHDNDCDGEVDEGFDADGDGFLDITACYLVRGVWDCDDRDPTIFPGAEERCNGMDDDCDGTADGVDRDGDGVDRCLDCDDDDPWIYPHAAEACDAIDNDCDGEVDELWDEDGDGTSPCQGDCDDEDPALHPAARESCDAIDNDCDGRIDEDFDLDADGQAICAGDCDDAAPTVFIGAEEVCDGLDNDCDPATLEGTDDDADGYTLCTGDCDDGSAAAYPGGAEACDGVDNDCDGHVDNLLACWGCTESADYVLCTTPATWAQATDVCEALAGGLVHVTGSSGNRDVAALAQQAAWIGLSDQGEEEVFLWTDGASISYESWAVGQPDDAGGSDCVVTNLGGRRGDWGDERCDSTYRFVCDR